MASRFDPRELLIRAKQMRALAEDVSDATTKERMLLLAKEYERAKRAAIFKARKKGH